MSTIVQHPHWGLYCYRVNKEKIEYLHHDGSWQYSADYFKDKLEIEALVKSLTPSYTPASNDFIKMNIGVSDFAKNRHVPGSGYSYFNGTWEELIQCVEDHWGTAVPGNGETTLSRKILLTVPLDKFVGTTATLQKGMCLESKVSQRQDGEDLFVSTRAVVDTNDLRQPHLQPDPVVSVEIVLYSRSALLENDGKVSGDFDWEIVAILAKTSENEPMAPLAMARNMLGKSGGTKSVYTAEQLAEAIYYWSKRVSI